MEIVWFKDHKKPSILVRVTQTEAQRLVVSLLQQILHKNCNSHRDESYTSKGEYFSIAVGADPQPPARSVLGDLVLNGDLKEAEMLQLVKDFFHLKKLRIGEGVEIVDLGIKTRRKKCRKV